MTAIRVLLTAAFFSALGTAAHAAIQNPGFESGTDSNGWPVSWTAVTNSYGKIYVVSSYKADDSNELGDDVVTEYTPREGSHFVLLKADGVEQWTAVKQTFTIALGETLSGWAAFDYQDYDPFIDRAQVRILDAGGALIATPWDVTGSDPFWDGPWTSWSWTPTVAGTVTLEYRVADFLDSTYDSYAMFDAPSLSQAEVPEPASLLVWAGLGLFVWLPARKRRSRLSV
jgi:hypothetical protein